MKLEGRDVSEVDNTRIPDRQGTFSLTNMGWFSAVGKPRVSSCLSFRVSDVLAVAAVLAGRHRPTHMDFCIRLNQPSRLLRHDMRVLI